MAAARKHGIDVAPHDHVAKPVRHRA